MVHLAFLNAHPPERCIAIEDEQAGLSGVIVLHSTALGPAAGGCRLWDYSSKEALAVDAVRLAEGMSYKNALAGLPLGGGKAVLRRPDGDYDRRRLFEAFGRAVERLDGAYVTAEDVGTRIADMDAVGVATRHVAGRLAAAGKPGGDPSPWTARGVFNAMKVAADRRLGSSLAGLTVAVQGLGNVGSSLCALLHDAGARLVVAEARAGVASTFARHYGAKVVSVDAILDARADIYAPCALGGVLNEVSIARLNATIVCGGANNVLATPEDGDRLADAGILYAPDYVVNAGGIINVAAEYLGWPGAEVRQRVDRIGDSLARVLDFADSSGLPPGRAAERMAREVIAAGGLAPQTPALPRVA